MRTVKNSVIAYCLTALFYFAGMTLWLSVGTSTSENASFLIMIIVGSAVLGGLWAAIPTGIVWVGALLVFRFTPLSPRLRATLAAPIAASVGALISVEAFGATFIGLGAQGEVGTVELSILIALATVVTFGVWSLSPHRKSPKVG